MLTGVQDEQQAPAVQPQMTCPPFVEQSLPQLPQFLMSVWKTG